MTRKSSRSRSSPKKKQDVPAEVSTFAPAERDDPAEALAIALWNEGRKEEALAILEGQIAVEKTLGRTDLPAPPSGGAAMVTAGGAAGSGSLVHGGLYTTLWERWSESSETPRSGLLKLGSIQGRDKIVEIVPEERPTASERKDPVPASLPVVTTTPRQPLRVIGLAAGLLVLAIAGAGLWIAKGPLSTNLVQPTVLNQADATQSAESGGDASGSDAAEPVTAALDPIEPAAPSPAAEDSVPAVSVPSSPPSTPDFSEPPIEDIPSEAELLPEEATSEPEAPIEVLEDQAAPPEELAERSEAQVEDAPEPTPPPVAAAPPAPRIARPRPEPPAAQARAEPQPRAESRRASQPREARRPEPPAAQARAEPQPRAESRRARETREASRPAAKPPTSMLSRRLAERRAEAERYAARRRAEAERAAGIRGVAEPPPTSRRDFLAEPPVIGEGPTILLGGRGLP